MKTVLLTGDSRGVGLAIKNQLISANYRVIGISRSSSEINYDLCNVEGIKDLYHKKLKSYGPIYAYINNAAIAYDDIITNLSSSKLETMYKVNVFPSHDRTLDEI